MTVPTLLAASAIVAVAALTPAPPPGPLAPTATTCNWTPEGPVSVEIGEKATFTPNEILACSGYTATISPTDGGAGFNADCSEYTDASPLFVLKGCDEGEYTMTIDDGSTVIQTISITVTPP